MTEKRRFDVSLRMTVFFGPGSVPPEAEALHQTRLAFTLGTRRGPALVAIGEGFPDAREADLVFLVDPEGCREVLGDTPQDRGIWHLGSDARALALAILNCKELEPAAHALRTIKSVELLWTIIAGLREHGLVPADAGCMLGELESHRILLARRLIDENWHEPLTLASIGRRCGLCRVKLTRGFRAMFGRTVGEAIAERRLEGAYQLLRVSDLPVSSVAYRCGYRNNASFTRAFSRRFGMTPSIARAGAVTAAAA